jgi:serine/threonine-protein kinase HipA
MITTAFINIWGHRAGAIAWNSASGTGTFEYEASFPEKNWDLSPIKMPLMTSEKKIYSFPETRGVPTFKGLPGLLADVLPDKYGNAIINAWLSKMGRSPDSLNPVETLCLIGKRGMGALEFEPAVAETDGSASKVELESLIQTAENILSGKKDFSRKLPSKEEKALLDILKMGSSAGGARAKAVVAYNHSNGELRSGQAMAPEGFSHWIIKFDGVAHDQLTTSMDYGRVEMAYHLMATTAGIEMTECRLLEENGRAHFMTRRFDRLPDNKKLHVQSFCALRHFDFNEINLYSYEQLFETMRLLALPYPEAEQLFRRMVFNVMARNCDDHTKNFSFVMEPSGAWKLSPAYDICHAYRPQSQWVSQHALSINGKRSAISREDILEIARQMNIKKPLEMIEQTAEIIGNWNTYASQVGLDPKMKKAIGRTLLIL